MPIAGAGISGLASLFIGPKFYASWTASVCSSTTETFGADPFAEQMIVAQGPMPFTQLPGLVAVRKNSEAVRCKIFIYMAHF